MKNYLKNLKKKKGFTLIELIIVLAIIAVISAIAIPKFGNIQKSARIKADIANAKNIATAVSEGISDGTITSTNSPINLAITTGNGSNLISSYLQSIPTPQLTGYDHFYVTIDNNGNITVYAGISGTANATANGVKVYPTQDSAYNAQ